MSERTSPSGRRGSGVPKGHNIPNVSLSSTDNRPHNAEESVPEALVPEVVRANLNSVPASGERNRHDLIAIAQRAYRIAERRGFAPGRELDDWLQAEREVEGSGAQETSSEGQFTG